MTVPGLAPRSGLGSIVVVWGAAAVIAVVIGFAAPRAEHAVWMPVGLGLCLILAFVLQLARGHAEGFLQRVAASVLGALIVMGLIGLGIGLGSLFAG